MQGDENACLELAAERMNAMKLCRIQGEFEAVELAELTAGRIRRSVAGVKRIAVQPIGRAMRTDTGRQRYTILPANMRMQNYATAVMMSDISDDILPEPLYRRNVSLLVLCDAPAADRACAIMQAAGALKLQKKL